MNTDYTDEREPLDTKSMLEEGFLAGLKGGMGKEIKQASKVKTAGSELFTVPGEDAPVTSKNTEKNLLNLYEAHDILVSVFSGLDFRSAQADKLANNINKIGSCIRDLGGDISEFKPLDHVSGLQSPDILKNANRVVDTTKECYTLGSIEEVSVSKNGKSIKLSFIGEGYKAIGEIQAKQAWAGNEAVDYIYTPGAGRMSVKASSDDGSWIDKSDDFEISWELYEGMEESNEELDVIASDEKSEKKLESSKEVSKEVENKIQDENDDDFSITEIR